MIPYIVISLVALIFLADVFITVTNNKFLQRHMKILATQNELLKKHVDNIEKYIMELEEEENGEDQN